MPRVSKRYLFRENLRERAIGFAELTNTNSNSVAKQLRIILQSFELSAKNCVCQDYDRANVMTGKNGDVQLGALKNIGV